MKRWIFIYIKPNPENSPFIKEIEAYDELGNKISTFSIVEKPLTIYLNDNHIITAMTVGDYPEYLAVGYLVNQNIIKYCSISTARCFDFSFIGNIY